MRVTSIIALFLVFQGVGLAATWYVPDHFLTIQGAISDASVVDGDTVTVRPNTYVENIDFLGKAITVESELGPDVTIIDGSSLDGVVIFHYSEGTDSVLDGFSITNGGLISGSGSGIYCRNSSMLLMSNLSINGNTATNNGGGVYCDSSSPTITDNIINENAGNYGGGIYCDTDSSPTITANVSIDDNTATIGGGNYCGADSSPIITGNTSISNNTASSSGGGISCGYCTSATPTITDNTIHDNISDEGGGISCYSSSATIMNNTVHDNYANSSGGGIYCFQSSPTIDDNEVYGNRTGPWDQGGGICCLDGSSPGIMGNTIYENSACDGGGGICCDYSSPTITNNVIHTNTSIPLSGGGGIYCYNDSSPTVMNNTLYENMAFEGCGLYCYESSPVVTNSILWDSEIPSEIYVFSSTPSITYCCVRGGYSGEGNIDTDPELVDPAGGDLHLTRFSPCINMGTNDGAPLEDIEGDARPYMGTVEMGADEFTDLHFLAADVFTLSEATGGTVDFTLAGGPSNAGRDYLLLGSLAGSIPGTTLPGGLTVLPLNWDMFTSIIISLLGTPVFDGFLGTLSGGGVATATFDTLGPIPGMADSTMTFAYTLDSPWDVVSNVINVEIVP